ncbi:MAG: ABC transporter substrate-binding protein [Candidatus Lokiarchaeota archaeon]|nr:ABC transporter substrate-binding protein [Candidatus Lokiarchaeota archaeon]
MERRTKQIVAIVAIAAIAVGTGVGIGIYFLFSPPYWETPGAPTGISEDRWIKVGLVGDLDDPSGVGNYQGAYLAVEEINKDGGIVVNGTRYYFAIASENTGEARPSYDITIGQRAVETLLSNGAEYFVGGFRTEVVEAYRENIMNAKKIFLSSGCAGDGLTEDVESTPAKYKYYFRVMPINETSLATQTLFFVQGLQYHLNASYYGATSGARQIDKAVILRENLDWTEAFGDGSDFQNALSSFFTGGISEVLVNPDEGTDAFIGIWDSINNTGAEVVIPVISAGLGSSMSTTYAEYVNPSYILCGINVAAQELSYWEDTNGACEYETTLTPLTDTNKTPVTKEYYNRYYAKYSEAPLYTATGAYDSIYLLADAINNTGFNVDNLISYFETTEWVNMSGSTNKFKFTHNHDVLTCGSIYEGTNLVPLTSEERLYSQTLIAQWEDQEQKAVDCNYHISNGNTYLGLTGKSNVMGVVNPFTFYPEGMAIRNFTVNPEVQSIWLSVPG